MGAKCGAKVVFARVSSIFSYGESILIQKRSAKKNIKFSNLDFFSLWSDILGKMLIFL